MFQSTLNINDHSNSDHLLCPISIMDHTYIIMVLRVKPSYGLHSSGQRVSVCIPRQISNITSLPWILPLNQKEQQPTQEAHATYNHIGNAEEFITPTQPRCSAQDNVLLAIKSVRVVSVGDIDCERSTSRNVCINATPKLPEVGKC